MTKLLCLEDSYLKECTATITALEENRVQLDQTVFYPQGGGQPSDQGTLTAHGKRCKVTHIGKKGGIWHTLESTEGLSVGDAVTCAVDWDLRYTHMRMHTASHVLAAVFHNEAGALTTGNQIGVENTRFDFNLKEFDRELVQRLVEKVNTYLKEGHEVKVYELPREEALKIPGVVKLANALPPSIKNLRMVEIGTVDLQADGGTHVKNTKEVGTIQIVKMSNKGSGNRRVYFELA